MNLEISKRLIIWEEGSIIIFALNGYLSFTLKQMNGYIWNYAVKALDTLQNTYVKMFRHFW